MSYISENNHHREINSRSRGRYQLLGPRPSPLRVGNSSSTIMKPSHRSKVDPVIIYLRSPKIIHVRPEEFMSLVQRLTGKDDDVSTNKKSYNPYSSPSSSSCDVVGNDESMAAMMTKRENLFDEEMKKPFNEVDYGDDQILGLSPTWLRFLACI